MQIFNNDIMDPLFYFLEQTKDIKQNKRYHPEIYVFIHSLQTMYCAFRETNDTDLLLAAMLHDIGKVVESHGHENIAVELLNDFCSVKTLWLIENHMRIWYLILGDMHKLSKVQKLVNHPWLMELVQLARFDKLGRNPRRNIIYDRDIIVDRLNFCAAKHFEREE